MKLNGKWRTEYGVFYAQGQTYVCPCGETHEHGPGELVRSYDDETSAQSHVTYSAKHNGPALEVRTREHYTSPWQPHTRKDQP